MKFAIIDDQEKELQALQELLTAYGEENHLSMELTCFSGGEDFLEKFYAFSYDLVFIDIYMKGMNGIEAARLIRQTDSSVILIFLTGSQEHMSEAFTCHVFDYIAKPASRDRVFQVLTDAIKILPQAERYLCFVSNGIQIRIPFIDLLCFHTTGHYSEIVDCHGKHYRSYITFRQLYHQLEGDMRFLLINKCILVNMDFIVSFEAKECHLTENISFPVVLRNAKQLEQLWHNYIFNRLHTDMNQRRLNQ